MDIAKSDETLVRIFENTTETMRIAWNETPEEIQKAIRNAKQAGKEFTEDNDYYWKIVCITFFSGSKATMVEDKLPHIKKYFGDYKIAKKYSSEDVNRIMSDSSVIRWKRKIEACIENAKLFDKVVIKHGSFKRYLDSFDRPNKISNVNLERLRNKLKDFEFIGDITVDHFLTDLGYPVLKKDRHIGRVMHRIGLIMNEDDREGAIDAGNRIANLTDTPIRFIDTVFVGMGMQGICKKENPECQRCLIKRDCEWWRRNRKK